MKIFFTLSQIWVIRNPDEPAASSFKTPGLVTGFFLTSSLKVWKDLNYVS